LIGTLVAVVVVGVMLVFGLFGEEEDEPAPVVYQVIDCFLPEEELEATHFAEFLPLEGSTTRDFDIEVESLCLGRMFEFHVLYSSDQGFSDALEFLKLMEKPPYEFDMSLLDFTFSRVGDLQEVEETLGWK